MTKISFVGWDTGDWVEVFIDGTRFFCGHRFDEGDARRLLEHLGYDLESFDVADEDGDLCYGGLEELRKHAIE